MAPPGLHFGRTVRHGARKTKIIVLYIYILYIRWHLRVYISGARCATAHGAPRRTVRHLFRECVPHRDHKAPRYLKFWIQNLMTKPNKPYHTTPRLDPSV